MGKLSLRNSCFLMEPLVLGFDLEVGVGGHRHERSQSRFFLQPCTHPPVSVWEIKAHRGEPYSLQVLTSHWPQASQGLSSSPQEPFPCHTDHPIVCPSAWAGCTLRWPPSLSHWTPELSVQERARAITMCWAFSSDFRERLCCGLWSKPNGPDRTLGREYTSLSVPTNHSGPC